MTEILVSRLLNALLGKGFVLGESHHTMVRLVVEGNTTPIHTWFSHGRRKADDWLLSQVAREIHLSRRELLDLVECTMSQERYLELMRQRGHLR